jgi:hypothetical protein
MCRNKRWEVVFLSLVLTASSGRVFSNGENIIHIGVLAEIPLARHKPLK